MASRPTAFRWLDHLSLPIEVGSTVVALLLLWVFTDISIIVLGGAGLGMGLGILWRPLKRRYGLNSGWGKLVPGFGVLGLGIYSFMIAGGITLVKLGFVLVGGWLILDAIYDLTTGTGATVAGSPNPMEQYGDAAIVGRALKQESRSIDELNASLDLSQRRIEEALDMLKRTEAIGERNGDYYARLEDRSLAETLRGTSSRPTDRLSDLSARLIRPLRLFSR